ncbi:MAG TPA: DUF1801 domain-containing protein [Candidatus Thermoplasmatota archaeon]|nr:DUF1801 domain-containing protein [Candidatus Thermoplasmatota archaeon]
MPKPASVDAYVEGVAEPLRPLFRALRAFVREHAPDLTERLYMDVPCYSGAQPLLYLADYSKHVNLGFYQGAHLPDPEGLLEGTGKNLRHVKLRSVADLTPELARLVRAAATRA